MTHPNIFEQIEQFLEEDIGSGDITAQIIPETMQAEAEVVTRDNMVVCGQACFDAVFRLLDDNVSINWTASEGEKVTKNIVLCKLKGNARALLTGERTALNLLQTLSATATISKRYADALAGTDCKVLDTRKTIRGCLRRSQ